MCRRTRTGQKEYDRPRRHVCDRRGGNAIKKSPGVQRFVNSQPSCRARLCRSPSGRASASTELCGQTSPTWEPTVITRDTAARQAHQYREAAEVVLHLGDGLARGEMSDNEPEKAVLSAATALEGLLTDLVTSKNSIVLRLQYSSADQPRTCRPTAADAHDSSRCRSA